MNEDQIFSSGNLDDLCGVWLSVNLCPSLIIYKDHCVYKVAIIHIGDAGQALPEVCTLHQKNECYFVDTLQPTELLYDDDNDLIVLSPYGNYVRKYL